MGNSAGAGETIAAAGGVVLRDSEQGVEVLTIHRPAHDDWSLPKGKLEAGETLEECALREVSEETGYECELGLLLGTSEYVDNRRGRPKRVTFFLMRPRSGEFAPNAEVDEIRWLSLDAARTQLSYEHERALLDQIGRSPAQATN